METERLVLRPLEEGDAESIYQNVKDHDIAKWTINIPHPYPKDGALTFIKGSIAQMQKGMVYQLAILLKETDEFAGVMSLINVNWVHKNAEIGYWTSKKHWNMGIATEAAKRMIAFGFEDLNMERIYAKCFHNNEVSRHVIEKCGMQYEGNLRHEVLREGKFIDMIYFGIIKEDWKEVNKN